MEVPDRWFVLEVPAPPRGQEHLLVEALLRLGSRSVLREGGSYVARLPPPDDVEALLREAEGAIAASTSPGSAGVAGAGGAEADGLDADGPGWDALDAGGPPATGPRRPPLRWRWEGRAGAPPTLADHPTTRACLAFLETRVGAGDRVADVGAGTGVLAFAAVRLGAREVVALERDPLAAAVARERAERAGARERAAQRAGASDGTPGSSSIRILELDVGPEDLSPLGPFDGIVANLEGGTLLALLEGFRDATEDGGWLVVSGAHRGEGARIRERAAELGLGLEEEEVLDGWWTGGFRK